MDDGHFLNKPVDKPRIQDGSNGEIHSISDAKTVDPAPHKDVKFDSLIRQLYDKFLTVGGETKKGMFANLFPRNMLKWL